MDSILELCEKGLNTGDYLTVSNNMKELYDAFAKKQRYALITDVTNETIISYETQIKDKVSFILLESEQEILIEDRMRKQEVRQKQNALYQLNAMKTELASITNEKRFLWMKYNVAKIGNEFEEAKVLFVKHRESVRREKEYKQTVFEYQENLKNTFP